MTPEQITTILTNLLTNGGVATFLSFLVRGLREEIKYLKATVSAQDQTLKVSGRRNGRRAAQQVRFQYDREGDLLYIDKVPPYVEQETEELGDDVIARLNPTTGEIENLEVFCFFPRLLRSDLFSLPVTADLRTVGKG